MDSILLIIFISLAIASVLNIVLKKFSVSHIIGYIITGTIISNIFHFNDSEKLHSLDLIGEFGIVFLMFTIGLELSFNKLKKMKELVFFNGFVQVAGSAVFIFAIAHYLFVQTTTASVIIALAFSLSSTAIVLSYLKKSKDVVTPYGEKSVAILIFQDLAVIPILLLISFLANSELSMGDVLLNTVLSATLVIVFMFTLGKKLIEWLLHFSTNAKLEELFLGSVLTIVIGASLLAHEMGFTYSLGAFIAGMIIAETNFHVKVESDIASYKDILLGAFFFSIGTKIDIGYFYQEFFLVLAVLALAMLIKALFIFALIRRKSNKSDAVKTAIALCQIGEFSFAIFSLAISENIISYELGSFLILVTVLSMIVTPFMVNNIYKLASYFVVEFFESDKITPIDAHQHTIICGFAIVGRIVAKELTANGRPFVIISDNLQHVLLARERGYMAYFGHLDKRPVLESLKVEQSASVILTVTTLLTKKIICQALLDYFPDAKVIVKINSQDEKKALDGMGISAFVHAEHETARLLVKKSMAARFENNDHLSNLDSISD
ncbi:cation:proton antiporter domain-containing protein [Paraglaciecola polaris]|uniref:Monovalent cation:H+ antiporter-2, CPA2 family n=1 Tax=Paraglaciecola polaris LMG 21857 TaxID=1129793 RepID=K6ZSS3_9ALTE|nr:cation:proton antiporter [Paraglaciecola polaris]GAC33327.1 monovalent cation:H+ antiporter-2, CPA2 family [Paraglaciecola polaris LMG 21857]|tara:strand:+ start:4154 stop:5803 length:1650 start_codon:yes stop_codon:yes gene_type:complete